jgi:sulfur-oxidizing protein SoxY
MNRREFVITATGAAALAIAGMPTMALGAENDAAKRMADFTGGATPSDGGITLSMPEIAENGNTVPIGVSVDSPMSADNYVESVIILADGNPNAGVVTFHFTPMAGVAEASTRMRLAKTQNVIAVAKMSDGSFTKTETLVKVTIGGCGG